MKNNTQGKPSIQIQVLVCIFSCICCVIVGVLAHGLGSEPCVVGGVVVDQVVQEV